MQTREIGICGNKFRVCQTFIPQKMSMQGGRCSRQERAKILSTQFVNDPFISFRSPKKLLFYPKFPKVSHLIFIDLGCLLMKKDYFYPLKNHLFEKIFLKEFILVSAIQKEKFQELDQHKTCISLLQQDRNQQKISLQLYYETAPYFLQLHRKNMISDCLLIFMF